MTTLNKNEIPQEISIFPLANAMFFPNTILHLNIFEPRYKKMVEDALSSNKMIGMIQTKQNHNLQKPDVFSVGCLGSNIFKGKIVFGKNTAFASGKIDIS